MHMPFGQQVISKNIAPEFPLPISLHPLSLRSVCRVSWLIQSECLDKNLADLSMFAPVLAKFADVFSRPWVYLFSIVCYVVGFVIIAFSHTLAACTRFTDSSSGALLTAGLFRRCWKRLDCYRRSGHHSAQQRLGR